MCKKTSHNLLYVKCVSENDYFHIVTARGFGDLEFTIPPLTLTSPEKYDLGLGKKKEKAFFLCVCCDFQRGVRVLTMG